MPPWVAAAAASRCRYVDAELGELFADSDSDLLGCRVVVAHVDNERPSLVGLLVGQVVVVLQVVARDVLGSARGSVERVVSAAGGSDGGPVGHIDGLRGVGLDREAVGGGNHPREDR